MPAALEGILVADLTRLLPGAVATQYLAAFGARVIKIEQPLTGDYARHSFSQAGENPIFAATNRGKQSIELDLKSPHGQSLLKAIAAKADILIESFRPGVLDRLRLGYQDLKQLNSRLIYVAISGYGQQGGLAQLAGHDINYLAMAGVLHDIGTPQTPIVPGVQLADLAGGAMQAVTGALLALQARQRTGRGQFVDVSMTHGVASALLPIPLSAYQATGQLPERGNELLSGRYACYGIYPCARNTFVAVGALEPKFWQSLCAALDLPPHFATQQFAGPAIQADMKTALAARFAERDAEAWFAALRHSDCCVTPVRDLASAILPQDPTPTLSATPGRFSASAPQLGEHTTEIEREFLAS